jgi:hypothetical protein
MQTRVEDASVGPSPTIATGLLPSVLDRLRARDTGLAFWRHMTG